MPLIARTTLLAKVEATYGTDAAPAGTDGVLTLNVKPDPRFASLVRNVQKASLGKLPYVSETGGNDPGGGITFDVEVRGVGGTAGTASSFIPKVSPLLKACGLAETSVVGTAGSASYAPASSGIPGCTIYTYVDGLLWKLLGCRGNAKLTLKSGQVALWTFTMQALSINLSDAALVAGTYEAGAPSPPAWVKYGTVSALKIDTGNYEAVVQQCEIDLGNSIQVAPNANVANNRNEIVLAERDIGGSFDPELVTVATYDFWTKMKAASQIALTAQVGTAQLNRQIVTASKLVMGQIGMADRAGKRAFSVPFKLGETTADDEVTYLYS